MFLVLSSTKDVAVNSLEHRALHTLLLLQNKYWKRKRIVVQSLSRLPTLKLSPHRTGETRCFSALSWSIYTFCWSLLFTEHHERHLWGTQKQAEQISCHPRARTLSSLSPTENKDLRVTLHPWHAQKRYFPFSILINFLKASMSLLSSLDLSSFKR